MTILYSCVGNIISDTVLLTYTGRIYMTWYTPKVSEVAVGLEINSYACAEV
ncbi:MAG: pyrroloquinoline quinone precursor peptide PqqA [Pelagibacteraceae bacterium]|nr:pyrroloquinoline quinone precursor peptide PqqA [Pelagibacteraceae bacterium]